MSVLTLFTKSAPTLAGVEFDAILEDQLEISVTVTGYPIESGARAADHRIVEPYRWRVVGAVSNNPIRPVISDFTGVIVGGVVGGTLSGLTSSSDETRSSSALNFLIELATTGEPFDIDNGQVTLSNMVITNLSSLKTKDTENGLIFEAQLQEFPTLETLLSDRTIKQSQLLDGDPSKSQLAELINKGEKLARDAGSAVRSALGGIFG